MRQQFSQLITWWIMKTGNFTGLLLQLYSLSFIDQLIDVLLKRWLCCAMRQHLSLAHRSVDWGTTETLVLCTMCQHFSQPINWWIMMTGNFTGLLLHAYSLTSQQIGVQLKHRSCCAVCQHFSQPITWRIMMTGNFAGLLLHLYSLSFVHGSADWGTTKTLVELRHASTPQQANNLMCHDEEAMLQICCFSTYILCHLFMDHLTEVLLKHWLCCAMRQPLSKPITWWKATLRVRLLVHVLV